MNIQKLSVWTYTLVFLFGAGVTPYAAAGEGHGEEKKQTMTGHSAKIAGMSEHAHTAWNNPPKSYKGLEYADWNDKAAANRGKALFNQQCAACHGEDGTGNGTAASSLEHPPTDLTHHFHMAPGVGDDYLFWRISEGGRVEPFRSANSAMPDFKGTLSKTQRWDVLAYIHQAFHRGFKPEQQMKDETPHGEKSDQH